MDSVKKNSFQALKFFPSIKIHKVGFREQSLIGRHDNMKDMSQRFIQQCWMLFLGFFVYSWIFRSRKLQNFEKSSKIFKNVAQIKSLCSSFSQNHFLTDSWRKYWKIGFRVFTYSPTIYALSNVAASPLTHDFTFYKEIREH